MAINVGRRNLCKLGGAGTLVAGLSSNTAQATPDPEHVEAVTERELIERLGLAPDIAAAAYRRLAANAFQAAVLGVPEQQGRAQILADSPYLRQWQVKSNHSLPADFLERSCALLSEAALFAVNSREVVFRCDAGCSFGGITLYMLRSRAARIALISTIPNAPLITSLQFSRERVV